MDNIDINDLDPFIPDIDLTIPEIDLEGALSMDDVRAFLALHKTPEEINAALKANHTVFTEKISIRIPHDILATIKAQAEAVCMPYQTFINMILAEYAWGNLAFKYTFT